MLYSRPNIIAFTETWFSGNHSHNLIQSYANDYTNYCCNKNSKEREAAIFVHGNIHSSHLCNISVLDLKSVWCKMSIPDGKSFITYIIGCVNRAPTCHINEFSDWFKLIISKMFAVNVSIPIIIMGNFNFPNINWIVSTSMYNDVYGNLILTYMNQLEFRNV